MSVANECQPKARGMISYKVALSSFISKEIEVMAKEIEVMANATAGRGLQHSATLINETQLRPTNDAALL